MSDGLSLKVENLHAYYGDSHVLHGVNFTVPRGECVTLIGRNGAGKTTTLRSIMGMIERRTGTIAFSSGAKTNDVIGWQPEWIARQGVAYVPEERGIYSTLNVTDNLMLPPKLNDSGMSLEAIYKLFPNLAERSRSQGTRLSGGEQQMLAIARVLRTGANFFLLDEPTEGLAPVIVQQIGVAIELMKKQGHTILLVEQNFRFANRLADRHFVVERGKVVDMILREDVAANTQRIQEYLGV